MKKRICIVSESLNIGGAEKGLTTLLKSIDYSRFAVDLFLFRRSGELLLDIPISVNVEEIPKKKCLVYIITLISKIIAKLFLVFFKKEIILWRLESFMYKKIVKEYDTSIGYLEKRSVFFNNDFIFARRKLGYIHTNLNSIPFDKNQFYRYYSSLDKIIAVSESCKENFVKIFPQLEDKIHIFYNLIDSVELRQKSVEYNPFVSVGKFVISSVGRITKQKGFDFALNVALLLKSKKIDFCWYIIGTGEDLDKLKNEVIQRDLSENFILTGKRSNPYPYMKFADLYCQPSRWEGYGITLTEAGFLNPNIIASNISEFVDQKERGVVCSLLPLNVESWTKKILNVYNHNSSSLVGDINLPSKIEDFYKIL